MERITFEGLFCDIAQCVGQPGNTSECPGGYCDQRRTWERLKEYEDTGLTPEQVPLQKWVSVKERLPIAEYEEHRRKWGTDPEFIVVISGAEESTTLFFGTDFKDRFCWYYEDTTYSVSHWMNWPMPPQRAKLGLGDPMTNAEQIRAMSDEELAEFIQEAESCGQEGASVADWGMTMLEWLRKPVEETK